MGRNLRSNSSVSGFLEAKGILQSGDTASIQEAKKEYWKEYKRQWKKAKRHCSKSYTILLSDKEANQVVKQSKRYHASPTSYIKAAALGSSHIIDPVAIGELRELMYLHYETLETMAEESTLPEQILNQALKEITEIEKRVFAVVMLKT